MRHVLLCCLLWHAPICCAPAPQDTSKKEGAPCSGNHYGCKDGNTILECVDGHYAPRPCRGPEGCSYNGETYACDESTALLGDSCLGAHEGGISCDAENLQKLRCSGGVFEAHGSCPGCHQQGREILCRFASGDVCQAPQFDCADGVTALQCHGERFISAPCRGPNGCATDDHTLYCDISVAKEFEPCLPAKEGDVTCSMDGHRMLACRNQRWEVKSLCGHCHWDEGHIQCG